MALNLTQLTRAVRDTNLVLTPRYNQWLMQHGDEGFPPWVVEKVANLMAERPRVRHSSFSSSSAGECHRKQVFQYLGVPSGDVIDPRLQNLFNDGKWRHLRWQACLLAAGILDDIEFPLPWPKMRSRGTMDGIGQVPSDHPNKKWRDLSFGFELKGVSPYQYHKYLEDKVKDAHRKQVGRYFLSSGFELFVIVYENKATQEWFEWVVEPDKKILDEAKTELALLNSAVDAKRLPDMLPGCKTRKGDEWKDCPFAGKTAPVCPAMGLWPPPSAIPSDHGKVGY
jgi:hypothetical protein